jgi:hypothetical protein
LIQGAWGRLLQEIKHFVDAAGEDRGIGFFLDQEETVIAIGIVIQEWTKHQKVSPRRFSYDLRRGVQAGVKVLCMIWAQHIWRARCERVFRGLDIPDWDTIWYGVFTKFKGGLGHSSVSGKSKWRVGFKQGVQLLLKPAQPKESNRQPRVLQVGTRTTGANKHWCVPGKQGEQAIQYGQWTGAWWRGLAQGLDYCTRAEITINTIQVDQQAWLEQLEGKTPSAETQQVWSILGKQGVRDWEFQRVSVDVGRDGVPGRIEGWMEYGQGYSG